MIIKYTQKNGTQNYLVLENQNVFIDTYKENSQACYVSVIPMPQSQLSPIRVCTKDMQDGCLTLEKANKLAYMLMDRIAGFTQKGTLKFIDLDIEIKKLQEEK